MWQPTSDYVVKQRVDNEHNRVACERLLEVCLVSHLVRGRKAGRHKAEWQKLRGTQRQQYTFSKTYSA